MKKVYEHVRFWSIVGIFCLLLFVDYMFTGQQAAIREAEEMIRTPAATQPTNDDLRRLNERLERLRNSIITGDASGTWNANDTFLIRPHDAD